MIFGIGTDFTDIRRFEKFWPKLGERFWKRFSSPKELELHATGSPLQAAKRFAAKESCAKALGVGIGRQLGFKNITVYHGQGKKPTLCVDGPILRDLVAKPDAQIKLDLSLSDEYPYVQSFVVISLLHG